MPEATSHRKKFGTELFLQLIYLLGQCIGLLAILFAVELRNGIKDLAIGLGLSLIATNGANDVFERPPLSWRRSVVAHKVASSKSAKSQQRSAARQNSPLIAVLALLQNALLGATLINF